MVVHTTMASQASTEPPSPPSPSTHPLQLLDDGRDLSHLFQLNADGKYFFDYISEESLQKSRRNWINFVKGCQNIYNESEQKNAAAYAKFATAVNDWLLRVMVNMITGS